MSRSKLKELELMIYDYERTLRKLEVGAKCKITVTNVEKDGDDVCADIIISRNEECIYHERGRRYIYKNDKITRA